MIKNEPLIHLEDVCKVYTVGGEEVRALDYASLDIFPGEFVSIVGPSGSGKSTLMNIIGCLDVSDSGQYKLEGQLIEQYSEKQLAKIRNQKIGFIFQSFNLLSKMTAAENIELPLVYQGLSMAERKERVFGIMSNGICKILWYDANHAYAKSEKRNT